ncbi:hypothetical protein GLOIN_2v1797354 [Rhizophagus clarus]|uniref:Uncharacterized protein n=1 Tax=Rhizophagus clarus TaxID=94130 RepID=A0A8H3L1L0_9GLOM|nr:hypothetical protein GLOIN_2v1797354 [Rhizophagus clarus]
MKTGKDLDRFGREKTFDQLVNLNDVSRRMQDNKQLEKLMIVREAFLNKLKEGKDPLAFIGPGITRKYCCFS